MAIAIKKTVKSIDTVATSATMENIPGAGMVVRVTIPVDMEKLRYKGGKSAYFSYGIWVENQKGCRIQGNLFISTKRLTTKTLDRAKQNYENKGTETIADEEEEKELF